MKRRLLSAFLAVMMVLTMAPMAFAADEGGTTGVAKIGNVEYPTLQAAVDAANNGDTIVLKKSISATEIGEKKQLQFVKADMNVTLDLNQNTITAEAGEAIAINAANITLTVKNGTIENFAEGSYSDGVYAYKESNNLTLTFENIVLKSRTQGLAVQGLTSNSNVNIVNSNITSTDGLGIYYPPKSGTLTISDSEINGVTGIVVKGSNLVVNGEKTIISGTGPNVDPETYYTGATDGSSTLTETGDAVYVESGYNDRDISVSISGGHLNSTNAKAVRMFVKNGENTSAKRKISVTGGTFSSDVSAYCDANYATEKNTDNTYTVKPLKDVAVAKIGDTYYKTLADAYAALPRNAGTDSEPTTITVLKDSEGKAIGSDSDKGMNYVIDFGGHTYTVGKPAVGSTGTETQGLRVLKGSKAVFKNGTLKAVNYPDMKMPVHTYGDVTFEDFTVDATEDSYAQIAYEIDNGSLNMIGNSSILAYPGKIGLYVSFWPRQGYTGGTTVNVNTTGKITGKLVYEWDDKADVNEQQKENKAVLNITNGYFDITGIQTLFTSTIPSELKVTKISISGGYFTTDPSAYVASGYVAGTSDVSGYSYKVVAKTNTGSVEVKPAVAKPEVKVDKIPQADKEKVAAAAKTVSAPTLGAETGDIVKDINEDTAKTLIEKATTVQGNNKKLYVQSSLKVEPTAYNETTKTLALDITPQYRVVASTATKADEIKLDGDTKNAQVVQDYQNMTINTPTEVTMELPTGFAVADGDKLSIQHTKNDTVEYYTGTVTKKDDKFYLTFTTNGFSPFVISVPEASIGENVYPTLQAAVDSVQKNETIKLAKDVDEATVVTVAKSINFKVDTNNKKFKAAKNIVAGSNTTVKVTGESSPYTYEFTYTKPSSGGSSGGSSSGKTTYKVTTSAVNNGGVNASPSNAEKGAAITITLSPDKGYKLDKLTVTDGSGKTVSTVKKSDTVYTFTMPASAVKVGVSYVKATETPSETKFNDVSANDWFASAVDYVTGKGMMNGTADNTFSPKANTTRGMVVTVLYRLENQPSTSAASFTDVASGAYYANAVAWANANGIVSGYGSGKFGPNDKVTREQLAAILYRYAQYKKYDVSVGEDTNILSYDDAQSISTYAIPAIQWACGAGVVTGKSGSKLDPKGNATRAEVAAMLMRFCENVK